MFRIITFLLLGVAPAVAQQTPTEQALAQKLMEEVGANIQLRAQIIAMQKQIQTQITSPSSKK